MEKLDFSKGYIFIPRTILESWIWDKPVHTQIWIDMVCRASWHDEVTKFNSKEVVLKRGEFCLPLNQISKKYGMDKRTVKRFLKSLVMRKWLNVSTQNDTTIYYIVDIDVYQPFIKENFVQEDTYDISDEVQALHPNLHQGQHPKAHMNMHPNGENARNIPNVNTSSTCQADIEVKNRLGCPPKSTLNRTYEGQKNAPQLKNRKINNNIFNNDDDDPSVRGSVRVYGHMRESGDNCDSKEQGCVCHLENDILTILKKDSKWIEAVQSVFNFKTKEDVENSLGRFWMELVVKGQETQESLSDFKSHYYGWMRIKLNLEEKRNNIKERNSRNNEYNERKPAPVSTEIPKGKDFRF